MLHCLGRPKCVIEGQQSYKADEVRAVDNVLNQSKFLCIILKKDSSSAGYCRLIAGSAEGTLGKAACIEFKIILIGIHYLSKRTSLQKPHWLPHKATFQWHHPHKETSKNAWSDRFEGWHNGQTVSFLYEPSYACQALLLPVNT